MSATSVDQSLDRHPADTLCMGAAFGVPLLVTLWRVSPTPQWQDDLGVVRSLALVPWQVEGVLSAVAIQLSTFIPIGGRLLRMSLISAMGLSAASFLAYLWARRLLGHNGRTPLLGPCLALAAVLMIVLGPAWQSEGTVAGGATVATAIALLAPLVPTSLQPLSAQGWLAVGGLVALSAIENRSASLAALAIVAIQAVTRRDWPTRRMAGLAALAMLVVILLGLAPVLLRPSMGVRWADLTWMRDPSASLFDAATEGPSALGRWLSELGVVTLVLGALGLAWGMARSRTRWLVAPVGILVALDLVVPASRVSRVAANPWAPFHLTVLAAVATSAALGVHTLVLGLGRANLPYSRAARTLLVVFMLTLVPLAVEDSTCVANRRRQLGAAVWTDEALAALPPRTAVLVRSPALTWRFWAERVVRDTRPDVLLVPLPLLDGPGFVQRLLEEDPLLEPLARDIALSGRPSELALTTLADARPLVVEFDPSWDPRLFEHFLPGPFWVGFSPHPVGRSDRTKALARGRASFRRVLAAALAPPGPDQATLAVLAAQAKQQAAVLATLGDRKAIPPVLEDLRTIEPDSAFASELERRLGQTPRGPIDVDGLVR
ncbi:hypothetical protein ACFL5O_00835 [Myxococcota bacterium]